MSDEAEGPGVAWLEVGPWLRSLARRGETGRGGGVWRWEWGGFLSRKGKVKIVSPGEEAGGQRREEM